MYNDGFFVTLQVVPLVFVVVVLVLLPFFAAVIKLFSPHITADDALLGNIKWEIKNDDYGRVYYANWETGEAVYEPPPEMGYRPPLGRNELGERVDPRLQALRWAGWS